LKKDGVWGRKQTFFKKFLLFPKDNPRFFVKKAFAFDWFDGMLEAKGK